jgi:hypothetical protein
LQKKGTFFTKTIYIYIKVYKIGGIHFNKELKMKSLKNLKHYTTEWDAIMDTELEIVEDAYNYDAEGNLEEDYLLKPKYSIKIPNCCTGYKSVTTMDGEQPSYNRNIETILSDLSLDADSSIADYPRHGDTMRVFYHDLEKAQAALFFIKSYAQGFEAQEVA